MATNSEFGAFIDKFSLLPPPHSTCLAGLTFAVKDIFDVKGYVSGFGNPDWARSHESAVVTAPVVRDVVNAGAICVGKTVMDEMAYSINGENAHYGTPINPSAPDRVPGGSSSGSAVAVAAQLVDFSLGSHIAVLAFFVKELSTEMTDQAKSTDTGGSVRVPAAFCGILGFRPSHAVISTTGVIPMAQSFDTVGWFARDPVILNRVGRVLLQIPDAVSVQPSCFLVPDDCFQLLNIPSDRLTQVIINSVEKLFGFGIVKYMNLGNYISERVPSLDHFMEKGNEHQEYIPSLIALSSAMRCLQRYEFKTNHGEWIASIKPKFGPGISERVLEAMKTTDEGIEICTSVKTELRTSLTSLLEDFGILVIPTVPGPPPKLQTEGRSLETFRVRAFSLLSIAGVSGFCQVNIPLGIYDNLPVSISLIAKHGADGFLLNLVETLYSTLKEQIEVAEKH